jgi:hypothetical protein
MDARLHSRIIAAEVFLPQLEQLELEAGVIEVELKALEAHLFLEAEGSVDVRKAKVKVHPEWKAQAQRLVEAQTKANNAKRIHEINLKKYDAEHLTLKTEVPVIKRQGA